MITRRSGTRRRLIMLGTAGSSSPSATPQLRVSLDRGHRQARPVRLAP